MSSTSANRPAQEVFQVVVPNQSQLNEVDGGEEMSNVFLIGSEDREEHKLLKKTFDIVEKVRNSFRSEDGDINVLIIEDDCDTAKMFERWLGDDFNLGLVQSKEGLDEIGTETDVVVVERFLETEDTEDIIDDIKDEWPDKSVILLASVKPEIEGIDWDTDDYIVKPVDREEFINSIKENADHGGD